MINQTTDLFGNPDEEAIYQAALAVPLEEKIRTAILMIQEYELMALSMDSRGYAEGRSFGKDSIVLKKIIQMSKVRSFGFYSNTTIDPPELIYYAKEHHKDTLWLNPEKHMLSYMVANGKGLPTRIGRWCCELYKERSFPNSFRVLGIRAEESPKRKGLWQPITIHSEDKTPIMNPILYWTVQDVWDFIGDERLPYCELYDEPEISRIGCIMCPKAGCKKMQWEAGRWPGYERLWKDSTRKMFDLWSNRLGKRGNPRAFLKHKTWENFYEWWITEGAEDSRVEPDCQMWMW